MYAVLIQTNLGKLNVKLIIIGWVCSKTVLVWHKVYILWIFYAYEPWCP